MSLFHLVDFLVDSVVRILINADIVYKVFKRNCAVVNRTAVVASEGKVEEYLLVAGIPVGVLERITPCSGVPCVAAPP